MRPPDPANRPEHDDSEQYLGFPVPCRRHRDAPEADGVTASTDGNPTDAAISRDGRYLYVCIGAPMHPRLPRLGKQCADRSIGLVVATLARLDEPDVAMLVDQVDRPAANANRTTGSMSAMARRSPGASGRDHGDGLSSIMPLGDGLSSIMPLGDGLSSIMPLGDGEGDAAGEVQAASPRLATSMPAASR
jgi:hypothetical protein